MEAVNVLVEGCRNLLARQLSTKSPIDEVCEYAKRFSQQDIGKYLEDASTEVIDDLIPCLDHKELQVRKACTKILRAFSLHGDSTEIFLTLLSYLSGLNADTTVRTKVVVLDEMALVVSRVRSKRRLADLCSQLFPVVSSILDDIYENIHHEHDKEHENGLAQEISEYGALCDSFESFIEQLLSNRNFEIDLDRESLIESFLSLLKHRTLYLEMQEIGSTKKNCQQAAESIDKRSSINLANPLALLLLAENCGIEPACILRYAQLRLELQQNDEDAAWDEGPGEGDRLADKHGDLPHWSLEGAALYLYAYLKAGGTTCTNWTSNLGEVESSLILKPANFISLVTLHSMNLINSPFEHIRHMSLDLIVACLARIPASTLTYFHQQTSGVWTAFQILASLIIQWRSFKNKRLEAVKALQSLIAKLEPASRVTFLQSGVEESSSCSIAALLLHQYKEEIRLALHHTTSPASPFLSNSGITWVGHLLQATGTADLLNRSEVLVAAINCYRFVLLSRHPLTEACTAESRDFYGRVLAPLFLRIVEIIHDLTARMDSGKEDGLSGNLWISQLMLLQDLIIRVKEINESEGNV